MEDLPKRQLPERVLDLGKLMHMSEIATKYGATDSLDQIHEILMSYAECSDDLVRLDFSDDYKTKAFGLPVEYPLPMRQLDAQGCPALSFGDYTERYPGA